MSMSLSTGVHLENTGVQQIAMYCSLGRYTNFRKCKRIQRLQTETGAHSAISPRSFIFLIKMYPSVAQGTTGFSLHFTNPLPPHCIIFTTPQTYTVSFFSFFFTLPTSINLKLSRLFRRASLTSNSFSSRCFSHESARFSFCLISSKAHVSISVGSLLPSLHRIPPPLPSI